MLRGPGVGCARLLRASPGACSRTRAAMLRALLDLGERWAAQGGRASGPPLPGLNMVPAAVLQVPFAPFEGGPIVEDAHPVLEFSGK